MQKLNQAQTINMKASVFNLLLLITLCIQVQSGDAKQHIQIRWFHEMLCKIFHGSRHCNTRLPQTATPTDTRNWPENNQATHTSNVCHSKCGQGKRGKYKRLFQKRIVGGKEAEKHSHPWLTRLSSIDNESNIEHKKTFCGGSILNTKFIVTAAHCVCNRTTSTIAVFLGDHNQNQSDVADHVKVTRIVCHPKYSPNNIAKHDNDIALLEMCDPIKFQDHIQPICIPSYDKDPPAAEARAAGWGLQNKDFQFQPFSLMEVNLTLLSHHECKNSTKHAPEKITKNMLCAGEEKKDTCYGDSGGPLEVWKNPEGWEIHGVISWGTGCGDYGYPGVYTKVFNYLDWMKQIMNNDCINSI